MVKKTVTLADVRQVLVDFDRFDVRELTDKELSEKYLWDDLDLYPDDIADIISALEKKYGLYVSDKLKKTNFYGKDRTVQEFIRLGANS